MLQPFQIIVELPVDGRVARPDHGIVAVATAGAFKGIADATIVVRRTPGMAVAANRSAFGNGFQHRGVILEDQQVLRLSLPLLERAAIAARQGLVTQPVIDDAELDVFQLRLNIVVQFKVKVLPQLSSMA